MSPTDSMSGSEFTEQENDAYDALTLRTACALCSWEYIGTAVKGREQARLHRRKEHPKLKRGKRRPTRHLGNWRMVTMDAEYQAEIEAERQKRAFLAGVELE